VEDFVSSQSNDSAEKTSSNNLNRLTGLYALAAANRNSTVMQSTKKNRKRWYRWALGLTFLLGIGSVAPSAQGQTYKVFYSFPKETNGMRPEGVIRDVAGNLYGTTLYGGTGNGAVFKLDTTGQETVLYSFKHQPDGAEPLGVIRDEAGNLYGTTLYGGVGCTGDAGCGTVYKLDTSGKETVLHRFGRYGDGRFPGAGVIMDAAGNLYGTTSFGGVLGCGGSGWGCGTIFKVDPSGNETVLYRFKNGADGLSPNGLIRDAAGNLYGTTEQGGANSDGTVFKLDATGTLTVLHAFAGADGCLPFSSLIQDAAGNLYGTTALCGDFGLGTVFKLDLTGNETVLYSFPGGVNGSLPYAGVVRDTDGNLYGTAAFNGDLSCIGTMAAA
jgi:uncharacterized repeat protein (TIGR03803 family)